MSMTHIHSDDCCINEQWRKPDDTPPPFSMWRYFLDQLIEALSERYFTGQANFYYDDAAEEPMILVIVGHPTQEGMEEKLQKFMIARTDTLKELNRDLVK